MKKIVCLMIILAVFAIPMTGYAASPWTEKATCQEKMGAKFGFGLKNVLLGWLDLFYEPHVAQVEGKNVLGGIGKGLVDTVANELGGALHLVTFFIPKVDIPLPDNGVHFDK